MHIKQIEFERRPERVQTAGQGGPWLAVAMLALLMACLALAMKCPVGPQLSGCEGAGCQSTGDGPVGHWPAEFSYGD